MLVGLLRSQYRPGDRPSHATHPLGGTIHVLLPAINQSEITPESPRRPAGTAMRIAGMIAGNDQFKILPSVARVGPNGAREVHHTDPGKRDVCLAGRGVRQL